MLTLTLTGHHTDGKKIHALFSIVPSSSYATGGDTLSFAGFELLKANLPAEWIVVQGSTPYLFCAIKGNALNNSLLKIIDLSTHAELALAIGSVVFSGSGLNDATSGGTNSATVGHTYVVKISATGTPDHFEWSKDGGTFSAPVALTGSAQTLADGVTITFATTTGHTLNDQWTITTGSYPTALTGDTNITCKAQFKQLR